MTLAMIKLDRNLGFAWPLAALVGTPASATENRAWSPSFSTRGQRLVRYEVNAVMKVVGEAQGWLVE